MPAMDAFATQPQSEAELQNALAEMPRSELQALGKTHGVRATLKSESLVGKLKRVLAGQLWPTKEEENKEEEDKEDEEKKEEGVKKADVVVGKKAAVQRKKSSSPAQRVGKLRKSTPVKATAKTPTKALDKIHAKQMAKQPTLQEHEQAKKQRAAVLLSGSKFSAVKMTRSKTKERFGEDKGNDKVNKTLSFTTPTKTAGAAKNTQSADDSVEQNASSVKKAKTSGYKPHAGPLPPFTGDSLFSPKKIEPRPAPMSVAVMKASRIATPKKTDAKKTVAPKKSIEGVEKEEATADVVTAEKKTTSSPSRPDDKKEDKKTETETETATVRKPTASAKPRSSVKAAASKAVSQDTKSEERRSKFTHDTKAKSAATRRRGRANSKSN